MKSLREVLQESELRKKAIGHFNISTIEVLWSIFEAAKEANEPVIIGVSEGERKFIGVKQAAALVKSIREEYDYPIYLNADHTYSFEGVKETVDAGFDMVIFDGAEKSFDENVAETKKSVEYARSINPDIIVEGELGYIGKSSKLLESVPEEVLAKGKTTPEEAKEFVEQTGVDALAPSVGNLHGLVKNAGNPDLEIALVHTIREAAGVPLVLHGGSGIKDDDFVKAVEAGMSVVHINTEIRKAWRDAAAAALKEESDEVAPYKILQSAKEAVKDVVQRRIALFAQK